MCAEPVHIDMITLLIVLITRSCTIDVCAVIVYILDLMRLCHSYADNFFISVYCRTTATHTPILIYIPTLTHLINPLNLIFDDLLCSDRHTKGMLETQKTLLRTTTFC